MARANTAPHLKLVVTTEESKQSMPARLPARGPEQLPLFHLPDSRFLGLVDMSDMPAAPFISLLKDLRPRWVMDLRVVPFFDLGGTSRRWFFELFRQLDIRYRDVSGRLGMTTRKDASLSSGEAATTMGALIALEPGSHGPGPILVLLEDLESALVAERVLTSMLLPQPKGGWEPHVLDADSLLRMTSVR